MTALQKSLSLSGKRLPPSVWDARLPLSEDEIRKAKLVGPPGHRREDGLRTAFYGALLVNGLYLIIFHALWWYLPESEHAQSIPPNKQGSSLPC